MSAKHQAGDPVFDPNLTASEAAALLGLSASCIAKRRNRAGFTVKAYPKPPPTPCPYPEVADTSLTATDVARRYGVESWVITYWRKKLNIPLPGKRGRKPCPYDVKILTSGTVISAARNLNVNPLTVSRWRRTLTDDPSRANHGLSTPQATVKARRFCVICGAAFDAYPSDRRYSCSPACSKLVRSRAHLGVSNAWSPSARAKAAAKDHTANLQWGTSHARAKVIADPASHPDAKCWSLVAPDNSRHEVVNLRRWLIGRLGPDEGVRVYIGLRQVAQAMRTGRPSPTHAKNWRLTKIPDEQKR